MNAFTRLADKIIEIRIFEESVLDFFSQNKISGTTHTCIGQEATAVAAMDDVREGDIVLSNHRCHGHFLAYGGPRNELLAEMMGKKNQICSGRGGSQHIRYKNFYTNGIQGGIVPNATGAAWAAKLASTGDISVVFLGDGTLGQGVIYESLNFASLFQLPVLFVIEDNSYAMSTARDAAVSGSIAARLKAFDIEYDEVESNDIELLAPRFHTSHEYVRNNRKPFCQIVHTYRLAPHSKGDDFRNQAEIDSWKRYDPLCYLEKRLGREYVLQKKEQYRYALSEALAELDNAPEISIAQYTADYTAKYIEKPVCTTTFLPESSERVVEGINRSLDELLQHKDECILLGEDICDPYGGAFKVTKGLSTRYPGRVINTPISEAALTGIGVGFALKGFVPVVEIMFGDFLTLCFDQIVNHAGKYGWLYDRELPLVIRAPMGAGRGYGATHSQSLEKYLIGVPFLSVLAISDVLDVAKIYRWAVETCRSPLLIVEDKRVYGARTRQVVNGKSGNFWVSEYRNHDFPTVQFRLDSDSLPDVNIITYGGMAAMALAAAEQLMIEDEIEVDVVVISQLSPLPIDDLHHCVSADIVVTLEEGTARHGVGSSIISELVLSGYGTKKFLRIASDDLPIPSGIGLERQILPDREKIMEKIRRIYREL